jgi:Cys-tRNA(Pro)/Cys-tRNA(Cys) deacylase
MEEDIVYEERLSNTIQEKGIHGELRVYSQSCHSVAEAARAAGVTHADFVKNVCMVSEDGALIVAIVNGEDWASTSRVAKLLGAGNVRIASPEEILERTGYPCGGTPSFGYEACFLVDDKVPAMAVVYTGGGSERALVKIDPHDLIAANGAQIARIRR